jgi:uncharacterized repeat protein (TIGR01451 family)
MQKNTANVRLGMLRLGALLTAAVFTALALAHNVGQVQTTKFFGPNTVKKLKANVALGVPSFQTGDLVEYIIQFSPVANGANSSFGANGYLTDYIPNGTEVVQASFVTLSGYDAAGDAIYTDVAPNLPGLMPTGWGASGQQTYAASGANFNNANLYDTSGLCAAAGFTAANCNGRLSELYADVGIFYSTDARTAQNPVLPARIQQGVAGNGYTLGNMTRGAALMALLGESVNTVHNLWDACMGTAFGGGAANALCTPNIGVVTAAATPFRAGSAVAGQQTGYPLDYTGLTGPWQRIAYNGSRIGDPSIGPSRNMAQTQTVANVAGGWIATAPLTISSGGLATNLGYAVSTANPLPAGANAVRWAVGRLTVGQTNYAKITLRLTQPVGPAGLINGSEVFGGDTSNLTGNTFATSASLDNPWTYLVPSVADNNSNLYISKIPCVYNAAATSCTPLAGGTVASATTITYQITYLNTGNAVQHTVQFADVLPCQVVTGVNTLKIGVATGPITTVLGTFPYTTATTAGVSCNTSTETRNTVTFPNMGSLGPGQGGILIMNLPLTAATVGAPINNTAILTSTEVPTGVKSTAVAFVGSTTVNTNPSMAINKITTTPNATAGGTAQYVISIQNTGVSALTAISVADVLPSAGLATNTRFDFATNTSIQSSGLTTATALVTSTTTAALSALSPYDTQPYATNTVAVNWNFGATSSLAAGGIITITFMVNVGSQMPASTAPYLNSARAIGGGAVPVYTIDASNVAGITVSSALSVTKTLACYYSTPTTCTAPSAGGGIPNDAKVRYNIAYANATSAPVGTVTLSDTLPCQISGASNVTMTASTGPIPAAFASTTVSGISCPSTLKTIVLGSATSLAGNSTGSFTYEVQLTTPSSTSSVVTNLATIGAVGAAPATSQIQNAVINVPNLQISKSASTGNVAPGGTVLYTITITNTGTAAAQTITVYDWLPTGTSTVANVSQRFSYTPTATISGVANTATIALSVPPTLAPYNTGTYSVNQQQISFGFPAALSLPVGQTLTIAFTAVVGTALTPNQYSNNAGVFYNGSLSASSNAANVNLPSNAQLSVTKNDGATALLAGSSTTYTVTFANAGPGSANASVVKDTPSAGLNCTTVTCASLQGGATCPSGMILGTPVAAGSTSFFTSGAFISAFPANSTVVLTVSCNVTATGQ